MMNRISLCPSLTTVCHFQSCLDNPHVIVEYVPYGDLLGYLRRSRGVNDCYYDDPDIKPTTNLTSEQMLKFAWQIADGMRYISSKKVQFRLYAKVFVCVFMYSALYHAIIFPFLKI